MVSLRNSFFVGDGFYWLIIIVLLFVVLVLMVQINSMSVDCVSYCDGLLSSCYARVNQGFNFSLPVFNLS